MAQTCLGTTRRQATVSKPSKTSPTENTRCLPTFFLRSRRDTAFIFGFVIIWASSAKLKAGHVGCITAIGVLFLLLRLVFASAAATRFAALLARRSAFSIFFRMCMSPVGMLLVWFYPAERHPNNRQQEERSKKRTGLANETMGWSGMISVVMRWIKSGVSPTPPLLPPSYLASTIDAHDQGPDQGPDQEPQDAFVVEPDATGPVHERGGMIPELAQQKLRLHRNLMLKLCRCMGLLQYEEQNRWHLTGNEQCFYDIQCFHDIQFLMTTALCIFRRLVPCSIPLSDFDQPTLTLRIRMALLSAVAIAVKFDDDSTVIPIVCLLRELSTAEEVPSFTKNSDIIHAVASTETHIISSVNVFEVSQYNHHRKSAEVITQMAKDKHIDDCSAARATVLSFFFVFNTYAEVEVLSRSYDTYTIGKAIAIATLACLACADATHAKPRKRWSTRRQFNLARLILGEIALKEETATKKELGGALVDPETWEYKATRRDNIEKAINLFTAYAV